MTGIETALIEARAEADQSTNAAEGRRALSLMDPKSTSHRQAAEAWWTEAFLRALRRRGYDVTCQH